MRYDLHFLKNTRENSLKSAEKPTDIMQITVVVLFIQ
jgi:hypothetical protein